MKWKETDSHRLKEFPETITHKSCFGSARCYESQLNHFTVCSHETAERGGQERLCHGLPV